MLALRVRGGRESEFVLRFEQFTSPVMAKGVEDTAFYCFNRMIGLNEVGGAPDRNGLTIAEFHDYCAKMQTTHPLTMTTLSTHDTKRSEDVRARLAAITELTGRWRAAVNRWSRTNAPFRSGKYPDRNTEYYLYQTLVGAWPITKERLVAHMEKAAREAKQQTSWTQQNKEFEDALRNFIEHILESRVFISELEDFVGRVLEAGRINSLAQTLLKLTAPGVPDTYQGTELWDQSLVDPDNRRPVDYDGRRNMLRELETRHGRGRNHAQRMESGLPKLWLVHNALCLRRQHPEWFGADAAYSPMICAGEWTEKRPSRLGYLRGQRHVAVIVPRWPLRLGGRWAATTIEVPPGKWSNVLTRETVAGGRLRVQSLLQRFPVALLTREAT